MAHINLLPWRAERRKQREREFYGQLGMVFVAGILVVIVWAFWMGQRIDNQSARNDYLKGQIKQVQVKIRKIKGLEKVRRELLDRKSIIEKLQSSRSQMVHLFDVMVKTAPDSIRLTSLKQNGQNLRLAGVAQSNSSVAEYMRRLEASPWLGTPTLKKTVNQHGKSRTPYTFSLSMKLRKPSEAKREAAADRKLAAKNDDIGQGGKPAAHATLPAAGPASQPGKATAAGNTPVAVPETKAGAGTSPLTASDKGARS